MMNVAMAQTMIGIVEAAGSVGRGGRSAKKGGAATFAVRAALQRVLGGGQALWGRMVRPVMGRAADVELSERASARTPILGPARAV